MFRSRSSSASSDDEATRHNGHLTGRKQSAIVALTAMGSAAVLLFSGALDDSRRIDIDSSAASSSSVVEAVRLEDKVMIAYLTASERWRDCMNDQPAEATADVFSSACGTAPEQPDDPRLNAYLAEVLEWHKCAAPRLLHGGMDSAIVACGPQPPSPLGN